MVQLGERGIRRQLEHDLHTLDEPREVGGLGEHAEVDLRPHAGIAAAQAHVAARQRVVHTDDERADRRDAEGALHVGERGEVPRGPHAEPHVVVRGPELRGVPRRELAHAVVGRSELVPSG